MATRPPTASGLDDVVAAETALSDVDGQAGRLVIRGHRVEDLVAEATFEDVCGLMWRGAMPAPADRERMRAALARAREHAFGLLPSLGGALEAADAMEALRAAVAHLRTTGDLQEDAILLTGAIPVFAAAWHRARVALPPVPPDAALTQAAD